MDYSSSLFRYLQVKDKILVALSIISEDQAVQVPSQRQNQGTNVHNKSDLISARH